MRALSETSKNQTFLKAVRERRRSLRIPQKVLAHEIGVSAPAYCLIEGGAIEIKLDLFIFLCKRLNLQAEMFLI